MTTIGLGRWVALVGAGLIATTLAAAAGAPPDAGRLVYLIRYVGTDYDVAVRDGKVVDDIEYGEVRRLTREVAAAYGPRGDAVAASLRDLERLIDQKAPGERVWTVARDLAPALAKALGAVDPIPASLPDLANGRRLFRNDCAPCHGPTGGGDGPHAPGMTPPPTPFRGDYLGRLTPRQVFHALSFGLDGTAMPAFVPAYSEAQRWDVAFFVTTLGSDFDPQRLADPPRLGLETLAGSSNAELLARLRAKRPEATERHVDWLRTSFVAADGAVVPFAGADAERRDRTASALDLQDAFASAAERLAPRVAGITTWVRDPAWVPEALRKERGDAWIARNESALRHPSFKPVRTGSALLLDDDGFLVSANHLVRLDGDRFGDLVEVDLGGRYYAAGIVGAEPMLDLVVLRLGEALTPGAHGTLTLGDADRLRPGHWVVALGDPPGPSQAMAVGVVSASPQRQCYQSDLSATLLQTSLVVPPGAMGGPVVDVLGHVVGLSVRAGALAEALDLPGPEARTLPVGLMLNLYEALKVAQSRRSPWIGISVLELPSARRLPGAKTTAFPKTGVYIDDVFAPSPASRAGIRPGDFLVALGGHPVFAVADFQKWLYVSGIGTGVDLELVRDGESLVVKVTIEERPQSATTT